MFYSGLDERLIFFVPHCFTSWTFSKAAVCLQALFSGQLGPRLLKLQDKFGNLELKERSQFQHIERQYAMILKQCSTSGRPPPMIHDPVQTAEGCEYAYRHTLAFCLDNIFRYMYNRRSTGRSGLVL